MRVLRLSSALLSCNSTRLQSTHQSHIVRPVRQRFGAQSRSEPELVATVLQHFPKERAWSPISKWAMAMPEDVIEALVPYGGLAKFAESQPNFFVVRTEGDVKVAGLSTMAHELCAEQIEKQKQFEKQLEKRRSRNPRAPRRYQPRIQ